MPQQMESKKVEFGGEKISLKYHLEFLKMCGEYILIYNKNIRLYFIAKFTDNGMRIVSNLINRKHDAIITFDRFINFQNKHTQNTI